MSALSEIVKLESTHSEESANLYNIDLFPVGKFFRAYEWSAWLVVTHINDFKVIHTMVKAIDRDVCYIGFPQETLEKWTPEGAVVTERADGGKDMQLAEKFQRLFENTTEMTAEFCKWRESIPIANIEKKNKNEKGFSADEG